MKPYLFGERHGIHIINLDLTHRRLAEALEFLRETVASGGKVLFVGTKRQAQAPIQLEAQRSQQYYVNNRWLGGMLTNFRTVKKSIERFKDQLEIVSDEEQVAELSKKDVSRLNRGITKYRKSLDGIREMTRLPDAMFIVDVKKEHIALTEARRLGIPVVAVVDSNCNPDGIDFVIPGNDDAIRSVQLFCGAVADACLEGAEEFNARVQSEVSEQETGRPQREAQTGRRVVDIQQPGPRRGGRGGQGGEGGGRKRREEPKPSIPVPHAASRRTPTPEPVAADVEAEAPAEAAAAEEAAPVEGAETPPEASAEASAPAEAETETPSES
jgi:small subunit ribosomal protein S2